MNYDISEHYRCCNSEGTMKVAHDARDVKCSTYPTTSRVRKRWYFPESKDATLKYQPLLLYLATYLNPR